MPDAVGQAGTLAGVILVGGESRRMGRDKASLPVPGSVGGSGATTLAEFVAGIVAQRCEPIFLMAAPGQPVPAV